jgi:hypothetical protein
LYVGGKHTSPEPLQHDKKVFLPLTDNFYPRISKIFNKFNIITMTSKMRVSFNIFVFLFAFCSFGEAFCQENKNNDPTPPPTHPTPPPPGEQPNDKPTKETKPIIKQTEEQTFIQKEALDAEISAAAPGSLKSGQNPQAGPESNFINRFKDIPVNLFTGTPIINFPIYTLSEPGGASVPIGLSFNSSGMKAHDVASLVGMNWSLMAFPQISRIVRGIPDEGKYSLNNDYSTPSRKGFYQYGLKADNDPENDSQSDIYFLNISGQSYKFTFDSNRKAHFFPETDIKLTVDWIPRGQNGTVGNFFNWRVVMPDGMIYWFAVRNLLENFGFESSFEIEAGEILDFNGGLKRSNAEMNAYKVAGETINAYYISKIITPQGHETNFEYRSSAYSYFRVAEQSATTNNCTFNNITKHINKVFNRCSALYKITNNNTVVEFNRGGWAMGNDEYTGAPYWYLTNLYPARTDIDEFGYFIKNFATGSRALHKLSVYDKNNENNILEWKFNYDYLTNPNPLFEMFGGYSTSNVGDTHLRRFKLRSIEEPDGNKYSFNPLCGLIF